LNLKDKRYLGRLFPEKTFEELLREHCEKAYNFAWRLVGNEPDARDLVQDALMKAYSHFQSYDTSRPFGSWLIKILQNVYLDGLRRDARQHVISLDAPPVALGRSWEEILPHREPHPLDRLSQMENLDLIQQALKELPPHYRTALILCDMENLSYEAISKVMDCPIGTVRSRVHQGRLLLKEAFEKLGDQKTPERHLQ
jgi:RNA polymerase sigma-70 factor (ECF subfamily)